MGTLRADIESLAREIFLRNFVAISSGSFKVDHVVGLAFDAAEDFYAIAEKRRPQQAPPSKPKPKRHNHK